jgi:hypothetical protein
MTGSEISLGFRLGQWARDHVRKIRLRFRFEKVSRSGSGNQPWFQARKWFKLSIGNSGSVTRSETVSGSGSEIRLVSRPSSESMPNLILGSAGLRKMTVPGSCRSVNGQMHPGNCMIGKR